MRLAPLALCAALLPATASAKAFVNGPKGCDFLAGFDSYGPIFDVDDDHLVLWAGGLEGIEWYCGFAEPFDMYLEEGEIEIRTGYCLEPGPFVEPGVFTLLEMGDGTVQLAASMWDEPLVLDICLAP